MRSKNAARNLLAYIIYEAIAFIGSIIFPRLIILTYGSQINGLTSTITRILSLVNLLQAGAVGAAVYQMYKPVADNDYMTQSEIIYSSRKFYSRVVKLYVIISLVLGIFYSYHLEDSSLSALQVFSAFLVLTINGAIQLFITSICDIYFGPNQKKYVVISTSIISQIINYLIQAIVIYLRVSFIYIYFAMLAGTIVGACLNIYLFKKYTKGKIRYNPNNKNYVIADRKYLMIECIGAEFMTAAPTVIVTTFVGLLYSSVFSVYSLVFISAKTVLSTIQISVSPIFGNIVKTASDEKKFEIYNLIEYVTIMFGTIIACCVAKLIMPFVTLYSQNVNDADYQYPLLAFFVIIYVCMFSVLTSFSYVSTVYGLFKQTCWITIISSGIGLILSVICTVLWGLPFVMIGLLAVQFITIFVLNIVIKMNVAWYKRKGLIRRTLFLIINVMFVYTLGNMYSYSIDSWKKWVVTAIITVFIECLVVLGYSALFERKNIKLVYIYIKGILLGESES